MERERLREQVEDGDVEAARALLTMMRRGDEEGDLSTALVGLGDLEALMQLGPLSSEELDLVFWSVLDALATRQLDVGPLCRGLTPADILFRPGPLGLSCELRDMLPSSGWDERPTDLKIPAPALMASHELKMLATLLFHALKGAPVAPPRDLEGWVDAEGKPLSSSFLAFYRRAHHPEFPQRDPDAPFARARLARPSEMETSGVLPTVDGFAEPRLVIRDTGGTHWLTPLHPFISVGRSRANHLQLTSTWVSRYHAVLWFDEYGILWLADPPVVLKPPPGGTYVNGETKPFRERLALSHGDWMQYGDVEIQLRIDPDDPDEIPEGIPFAVPKLPPRDATPIDSPAVLEQAPTAGAHTDEALDGLTRVPTAVYQVIDEDDGLEDDLVEALKTDEDGETTRKMPPAARVLEAISKEMSVEQRVNMLQLEVDQLKKTVARQQKTLERLLASRKP